MADAESFQTASEHLERWTNLDRLEARGTLRIVLKEAGFDSKHVLASDLRVVIERLLPKALVDRGVEDVPAIIERLASLLSKNSDAGSSESPESVFQRLGEA